MTYDIAVDDLWPRDAEHRFRLYGRRGDGPGDVLAAAADMASIGVAIEQLHADAKAVGGVLGDSGALGILDVVEREWVVSPFRPKGET